MGSVSLSFESYLDGCAEELGRTVEALDDVAGGAVVPTCPGWTAADLSEHLRTVYARWRVRLAAGEAVSSDPSPPTTGGAGLTGGSLDGQGPQERLYVEGTALFGELGRAGPDAPCWNWSGEDETGTWLARRLALETAVHRVDAELTAGEALPVETELAADGIDERIGVHLRVDLADAPRAGLGGSLCLVCSDLDAAFVVEVTAGKLRWRRGRGPADAALVGTSSDLFLFTWNRVPLGRLSLTGRRDVAESWANLPS